MTVYIRKYFWTFNLLTIAFCALLAAKAIGRLVETSIPTAKPRRVSMTQSFNPMMQASATRDVSSILSRNIFCSTCERVAALDPQKNGDEPDGEEPANDEPVKTSLNLKLIATLVSNEDRAWSFAAIQDLSDNKSRLFAIGSKLSGDAVVSDIHERKVMIQNGHRAEYLEMTSEDSERPDNSDSPPSFRPAISSIHRPSLMPGMEDIAKGIRKVGEGRYEIQRSSLNKVISNTTLLARSARIVPSMSNGKPNGFKLYAIRPGSLYSLLGMQNGDTLNAVNGHAINTPDKALEVYTKLRSASHVSISFSRRGKHITHEYTIR